MNRGKLLVQLSQNNVLKDLSTGPAFSYKEKVYSYLETLQKDPYEFVDDSETKSGQAIQSTTDENLPVIVLEQNDDIKNYETCTFGKKPNIPHDNNNKKINIISCVSFPPESYHNAYSVQNIPSHSGNHERKYITRAAKAVDYLEEKSDVFSSDNSIIDRDYRQPTSESSETSKSVHNNNIQGRLKTINFKGEQQKDFTSSKMINTTNVESQLQNDCKSPLIKDPMHFDNVINKLKKNLCPLCYEAVDHFARHLSRKHSDEETVKKILEMPPKSQERRMSIIALRKKGNFILHGQKNILNVVRSSNKNSVCKNNQNDNDYFPCVHCLGFYKKSYLWRHNKICKSNIKTKKPGSQKHLSESQTFLASTGLLGNILNKGRIKNEVFTVMRPDEISYAAKTDSLICLFGESYMGKHKRKQMNIVVSNKLRELARLKLALQKITSINNLIDILKPECYELIITATKIICGYNADTKTYTSSSLAMHMGTTLKFICDVATKAILTKNPLFLHIERDTKIKEIKDIRHMINMHWCNDIASLANKVLNEQKAMKPKLLPFTEDIKALNSYLKAIADEAYDKIISKQEVKINYKRLTECTLVLVLVFNRKRVGEVQFLTIESYENIHVPINQDECLSSLTELEKTMSASFKRVIVFGKGSKPVPILFTKLTQKYIKMLLTVRQTTDIVPKSNSYLFANPGSCDRWMSGPSVLRKYAYKCGAKNPELLTGTRFRKQIATILQLMNFEQGEMEQIARFMGHTEKTHKEFYRLTEDVYQTAKVAKVLLLLNIGKGSEFKGKSLEEIEVPEELEELEEKEVDHTNSEEQEIENKTENKAKESEMAENVVDTNLVVTDKDINKHTRKRWSAKQKQLVLKHFKKHIQTRTAPRKQECNNFIENNSNLFSPTDWVRIKTLVFNTYRNK